MLKGERTSLNAINNHLTTAVGNAQDLVLPLMIHCTSVAVDLPLRPMHISRFVQ